MSNTISFDESFYLSQNPDVAAAVSRGVFASGAQHFQLNGRFEGRNPNAFFNTSFYLGQYPDVARAGINPLTHFLNNGAAEGRFANATEKAAIDLNNNGGADDFNEAAYRTQYSDVDLAIKAGTFKSAYQHFVQFGQFEARVATLSNGTTITGPFTNSGSAGNAGATLTLTPGLDLASSSSASTSGVASDFRFTNGNQTIQAGPGSLNATDVLLDSSTTDNDVLNAQLIGDTGTFTAQNIETINATFSAGTPILNLTNVTGTKAVNVNGTVTGTVAGVNTNSAPTIGVTGFTNTLNVNTTTLAGTAAAGTADTLNLAVSGATFGTTAATQSVINLTAGTGGTLETLNIASNGTAVNTFGLTLGAGVALGTTNITGSAGATIRVDSATVSGTTIAAASNTGIVTLDINRDGLAAATTNLTNVSGVEAFVFRDATAASAESLSVTNIEAGSTVTLASSFAGNAGVFSVRNAATNTSDVLSLTLDHATDATSVALGTTNVQNVETLNLVSNGNSAATLATGNTAALVGDFTTINLTGDTSVNLTATIDNADAGGIRTTTISAAGLTGTAGATITANAAVAGNAQFNITGSARADIIVGGANNDVINAGDGNDTINAGAGNNTITLGNGTDTVQFRVANVGVDSIVDFNAGANGDILAIESDGITATLNAGANFVKGGVGVIGTNDSATAFASNSVNIITDRAFASFADVQTELQVENGGTALTSYAVVFLNSTTGVAELYIDDTTANVTNDSAVAAFQNITTLAGVTSLTANNFVDLA